jgi:3-deoxy-alpha-D-manno-octulosonate 8-oxidase
MVDKHQIDIPKNICANLTEQQFEDMIRVSLSMAPLWENALGKNWQEQMTPSVARDLFEKM